MTNFEIDKDLMIANMIIELAQNKKKIYKLLQFVKWCANGYEYNGATKYQKSKNVNEVAIELLKEIENDRK